MASDDRGQAGERGAGFDKREACTTHQIADPVEERSKPFVKIKRQAGCAQTQDLRPQTAQFLSLFAPLEGEGAKLIRAGEKRREIETKGTDHLASFHDREPLAIGAVATLKQARVFERLKVAAQLAIGAAYVILGGRRAHPFFVIAHGRALYGYSWFGPAVDLSGQQARQCRLAMLAQQSRKGLDRSH